MSTSLVEQLCTIILSLGLTPEGCTYEEIETIKSAQDVDCLPQLYIDIMLAMGMEGLDELLGGDCTYSHLKTGGILLAAESSLNRMSIGFGDTAFVFYNQHGILYYWFDTKDCLPDPPVYECYTETETVRRVSDKLSHFMLSQFPLYSVT